MIKTNVIMLCCRKSPARFLKYVSQRNNRYKHYGRGTNRAIKLIIKYTLIMCSNNGRLV